MAITPIQPNIENTKSHHKHYNEAKGAVDTTNNVKPLHPEGHLVHDSISNVPKYFLKDIAYDMKAVKDGLAGNANDHQLGRLNDVGLKLGGIGIATMLAARTKNPMVRLMEYAGLGAFLASMTLYPKIAVNIPSRIVQGYDIGKEYIDDQGRKKSVYQDPNYIPFDMYQGEFPDEDLDLVGDKMGIPRGIKNRHDLIKEQARKRAIQNNTLWMMTAGVVPVMSALICYGLERGIAPVVESARNMRYNAKISNLLTKTGEMTEQVDTLPANSLSNRVEKLLANYKNHELPKAEYDNLVKIMTQDMDSIAAEGIKQDLAQIFGTAKNGVKSFSVAQNAADEISMSIRNNLPARNKAILERVFVATPAEVAQILDSVGTSQITEEQLLNIKGEFRRLFEQKIANEAPTMQASLKAQQNDILEAISKNIQKTSSNVVNENNIKDVVDFAKVLGEFKKNQKALDKCKSFKVEFAPETVIARSYGKFENTLLDVLDIKYKDLKQMRLSDKEAQKMFDAKLSELAKDEVKFEKAIQKLTKAVSDMEVTLNGANESSAHLKDLITAIENNYNNTAKRIASIGKFNNTVDRLVKEDVSTLSNSLHSRQELFDMLDGVAKNKYADFSYWGEGVTDAQRLEYAKFHSKGVGSSKNLEISRIIERYQGAKNSFNRILHLFDIYKRPSAEGEYNKAIIAKGKEALMSGTSSEHTLKLHTVNNPTFYNDLMRTIWSGNLEESTIKGMDVSKDLATGDVAGRFKKYLNRFRDIMGNNNIDFTKPNHVLDNNAKQYTKSASTRMAKFNLVAQNPVDLIKNAAEKRYSNQKWLRIAAAIGGTVLGAAWLAQFRFGKITNPHTIQKLEAEDANN